MLRYYQRRGYTILANYHLEHIPYKYFNSVDDLGNLELDAGYGIAIDELAKSAEARRSSMSTVIDLSHQIMQSRKISKVSMPTRMFFTAQLISSVEYRLRSSEICDMIWKPELKYVDQHTGRPILVKVEIYTPDKQKIDEFRYNKNVYFPPLINFKGGLIDTSLMEVCSNYNHRERIESMSDTTTAKRVLKYATTVPEEFKRTKDIKSYLKMQRELTSEPESLLDTISSWVNAGRLNPLVLDELRNSINPPEPEEKNVITD
jgi:hypothetical protein